MKKSIYAVQVGRMTGIFDTWTKCAEQIKGYRHAVYISFKYWTNLEDEPEDVVGSLRYAIKEAEEYLERGNLVYQGESTDDYLKVMTWREDGFLPFIDESVPENAESVYNQEEEEEEEEEEEDNEYQKFLSERLEPGVPEKYWKWAKDMGEFKSIITNSFDQSEKKLAAKKLGKMLRRCAQDVNLIKLTAVYRDKKAENNLGYDTDAASRFIDMMLTDYPEPESSEDWNKEEEITYNQLYMQTGDIETELKQRISGQDAAIEKLIESYFNAEGQAHAQSYRTQPRNVYFLAGPPGVGKTFMAQQFAAKMQLPFKRFDMSEYVFHEIVEELLGYGDAWKSPTPGKLTQFVRENPKCVLLFDEIEKAHTTVIRLFLQILDAGSCEDKYNGGEVSFRNTVIFFTTNAGKQLYDNAQDENLTLLPDKVVIDALKKDKNDEGNPYFPPEILSRLSAYTVIMLNHLSADTILELVQADIKKSFKEMKKTFGYSLKHKQGMEYIAKTILYSMGGSADARETSKSAHKLISREMYRFLGLLEEKQILDENSTGKKIDWKCNLEGAKEEIRDFYLGERDCVIPVFGTVKHKPIKQLEENNVCVQTTTDFEEYMKIINGEKNVPFAVVDYIYGLKNAEKELNFADAETIGRDVFFKLREENKEIPVYILNGGRVREYTPKEKKILMGKGARGLIDVQCFTSQLEQIYKNICCCQVMNTLTAKSQVLTYETRQEFDEKTNTGSIVFCDFKLERAVEAEDKSSLLAEKERPKIKFDDVIGAESAKAELKDFVQYLQNPRRLRALGFKPPKGILLYGPPGTGKTMLAKAMAGESDATFFPTSAAKFVSKGIFAIEQLFARAKKYAPSIIFIDEIDAIGKARTGSSSTAATESMLNALLEQMDGFYDTSRNKPVFVLAATNYGVDRESGGIAPLDEALLRRFDNRIRVGIPKEEERRKYIQYLLDDKKITTVSQETVNNIAKRTPGLSFAILQNVFEIAFRNAARKLRVMRDRDLMTALEEYNHGEKRAHTEEISKSTAVHELGHAYVTYMSGIGTPTYITIESRGNFGGYTNWSVSENVAYPTKEQLLARIRISLAGRAAEEVFYGKAQSLNIGAGSDLQHATYVAFQIVCAYGMEDNQLIALSRDEILQSALAEKYVGKVNEILNDEMKNAIKMIEEGKKKIQKIVPVLMRESWLTGEQFEKMMKEKEEE